MARTHLAAVVFDWAGTLVDHGSIAPMRAFVEAFARFGVELTMDEARGPMGLAKRDHIRAVGAMPAVASRWQAARGGPFTEADVEALHEVFVPLTVEAAGHRAELLPGVGEVVAALRRRGLRIGSTTGYTRQMMEPVLRAAERQGFVPDSLVCAGDLAHGRPTPAMMYRTFLDLAVWPACAIVKVDDTPAGIGEGLAAGTWTVGVAVTGNAFALSAEETAALSVEAFSARRARAISELRRAGAHYVLDGVHVLLPVLDDIEGRLARGERP